MSPLISNHYKSLTMAYGYRSRRRTRRSNIRRRPSYRRVYRRSTRKTTLRPRRRMMSKRRILNITSVKKHDNMLPTSTGPDGSFPAQRGFIAAGNVTTMLVWCPTARGRDLNADANAVSLRTTDLCYMRGLKEKVNIQNYNDNVANFAANWKWRRIVFTAKGLYNNLGSSIDFLETSNGYVRLLADQSASVFGSVITSQLFQGVLNTDWNNPFTAKTDTTKYRVLYDKTFSLSGGNGAKRFWNFNMWHGFNKNLQYANEEQGKGETVNNYSTNGRPGMGDVYVVDLLQCAQNTAADTILFEPEATLYWHEK